MNNLMQVNAFFKGHISAIHCLISAAPATKILSATSGQLLKLVQSVCPFLLELFHCHNEQEMLGGKEGMEVLACDKGRVCRVPF